VTTVTIGARGRTDCQKIHVFNINRGSPFELLDEEGVAVIMLELVIVDAVGIGRVEVASAIPLIPLSTNIP